MATGYDDSASLAEKLRTRALRVEVVAPRGRVLPAQGGPPALTLRVLSRGFARDSLTCFATGQGRAGVVWLDRQRREVQVRAVAPLPVGRSKYTCTAPVAGRPGAYFWFSHRWLSGGATDRRVVARWLGSGAHPFTAPSCSTGQTLPLPMCGREALRPRKRRVG